MSNAQDRGVTNCTDELWNAYDLARWRTNRARERLQLSMNDTNMVEYTSALENQVKRAHALILDLRETCR